MIKTQEKLEYGLKANMDHENSRKIFIQRKNLMFKIRKKLMWALFFNKVQEKLGLLNTQISTSCITYI